MNKVCIIGGGFAGLTAMAKLSATGVAIEGILIDRKMTSDFLPALPDCIGRGISPDCLAYKIEGACGRAGFKFVNEEVTAVDLDRREISTRGNSFHYDYLIIAGGSETNFYDNENILNNACKLDSAEDAMNIVKKLRSVDYDTYIIGGGGYTGVEVAANLRLFLTKAGKRGRIIIVERSGAVLGPLPGWMKEYAASNFKRLDIEVMISSRIEKIEGAKVIVSGGNVFDNAFVIWAAGVRTAGFIQNLKVKKSPQGRIEVDEYLALDSRVFAAGDAAYVKYKGVFLRMAVQFSIAEAEIAAQNIINGIKLKPLRKYRPLDLGYIIPMANNRSCGDVFGIRIKGFPATVFHFIMCIYRSWSWRNRLCIVKKLLKMGG